MSMGKGISNFIIPQQKPKPVKRNKSSKAKPKAQNKQNIRVEEPKILIDPADFSISSLIDGNGIHVITKYLGQSVNVCTSEKYV
jgi:hypothetical protein